MNTPKLFYILTIILVIMIFTDTYMTDMAMERGGYYETNPFTNKFGLQSHMILLLGITYLLGQRAVKKECLVSRFLISLGVITWTLNNIYSIILLS